MDETWKDIEGFEGLYQVSNLGRIKSFCKSTKYNCPDEMILKPSIANSGYCQVTLYSKPLKKKFLVHRLVATAFIPNPNNLPQINHKDENPLNNNCANLEWCTARYNNAYGTARFRAMLTKSKMVEQFLPTGEFLARYACATIAAAITGVPKNLIGDTCTGQCKTAGGFVWKYLNTKNAS